MTSPATVTISSNTYNVYVDQATCAAYLAASLSVPAVGWSAAPSTQQAQAMVMAARMFDRQTWQGTQVPGSPLQWPRTNVVDKFGNAVPSSSIPQDIINGFCELAAQLFSDPALQDQLSSRWNIQSFNGGPATVTYFHPQQGDRFPMVVQELVGPYFANVIDQGGALGTDSTQATATDPNNGTNSQFTDLEQYSVTKGV